MKPIETENTMGLFDVILTTKPGLKSFTYQTVTGENMAKQLVKTHGEIDEKTGITDRCWSYRPKLPMAIFICGHIDGVDCGSGQRSVNDFVTDSEDEAKRHIERYQGSWSQSGWYREIPFETNSETK